VLLSLTVLPIAFILRSVFDTALPNADIPLLLWLAAAIGIIRLGTSLCGVGLRRLQVKLLEDVAFRLRDGILQKVYSLSREEITKLGNGPLHTVSLLDTGRVKAMSNALLGRVVPAILSGLALAGLLFYLNLQLTLVMLGVLPVLVFVAAATSRMVGRRIKAFHDAIERFSRSTSLVLANLDLTQIHACEHEELERQRGRLGELRHQETRMGMACCWHGQLHSMIVATSALLILVVGGAAVARGELTLGGFFAFYFCASLLNQNGHAVLGAIPELREGWASLLRMSSLFEHPAVKSWSGTAVPPAAGGLEATGLGFSFGPLEVLREVDFRLDPGQRVVITGPNGSGKTTLMLLLLGLYRPQRGQLSCGGCSYEDLDLARLRRDCGVVLQEPPLFEGTVRENLVYGFEGVSEEALWEALAAASADEWARGLPEGLDTEVGDQAVCLSGGQRQRLAIARALLRKPRFLLLDEPSNHLDGASLEQLLDALSGLPQRPGVLIIAHDPRVLSAADEHYVMSDGRLLPDSSGRAEPFSAVS
jgi:ABC-type bacteriocin/lantibiotic exporter with double-glycine peptidase domain